MSRLHTTLDRAARYAAWFGGAAILLVALMITADVVSRNFLPVKLQNVPEISGYLFVVSVSWAYSFTLLRRGHIRIDTLYHFLPRPLAAVVSILGMGLLLFVVATTTWYAFEVLEGSWSAGSRSISTLNAPLWIPQSLWVAGLVFFVLTIGLVVVAATVSAFSRDWDRVNRLVGFPTVDEMIEDEKVD